MNLGREGGKQGSPEGNCGSLRVSTWGKGVEIFIPAPTRHHSPLPCISQLLDKGCPQQGEEFLGTRSSGHTKTKQIPAAGRSSSRKEELVVLLGVKVHPGAAGHEGGKGSESCEHLLCPPSMGYTENRAFSPHLPPMCMVWIGLSGYSFIHMRATLVGLELPGWA